MRTPRFLKWLAGTAASAVVIGAVLLPATPAGADTLSVQIANVYNGLCLSPAGGSNTPNVAIVQFRCDFNGARLWNFVPFPGGGYYIRNAQSGLCLSPAGGSRSLNNWIVQYFCDSDPARSWTFPASNGSDTSSYVLNRSTYLCLSPAGASTGLNVTIVQYYCDSNPSRSYSWHY